MSVTVWFTSRTRTLPEVLRDAGFVLSASLRESFGAGLRESAASAAVPVVRNWPLDLAYGGARAVFPSDWVVADVAEAVRRISEHAPDSARRQAGEPARAHVVDTWSVVARGYRDVLLAGDGMTPPRPLAVPRRDTRPGRPEHLHSLARGAVSPSWS
jgi:glycosyltransferase involved in cell wall biosynthesis